MANLRRWSSDVRYRRPTSYRRGHHRPRRQCVGPELHLPSGSVLFLFLFSDLMFMAVLLIWLDLVGFFLFHYLDNLIWFLIRLVDLKTTHAIRLLFLFPGKMAFWITEASTSLWIQFVNKVINYNIFRRLWSIGNAIDSLGSAWISFPDRYILYLYDCIYNFERLVAENMSVQIC